MYREFYLDHYFGSSTLMLFEALLGHLPMAVYWKDRNYVYRGCNAQYAKYCLLPSAHEIIGKTDYDLSCWKVEDVYQAHSFQREVLTWKRPILGIERQHPGDPKTFTEDIYPLCNERGEIQGMIGLVQEVTELKKMQHYQEEVQEAKHLRLMAGGLAHDFNNSLALILGACSLAKLKMPKDSSLQTLMERIGQGVDKSARLAHQFLLLSKGEQTVKRSFPAKKFFEDAVALLRSGISQNKIVIELKFDPQITMIEGDATQLQQLLNNLVINATQAIGELAGQVTVEVESAIFEHKAAVKIIVSDDGPGIDPAQVKNLFRPYFTTKKEGNGIGLASCQAIVKGHGGVIEVESKLGLGTTFSVMLPLPHAATEQLDQPLHEEKMESGQGHILYLEDEDELRAAMQEMLQELGYSVSAFKSLAQGRDFFQHSRQGMAEKVDLILTDFIFPKEAQNGYDVLSWTHGRPDCPVVLLSGHYTPKAKRAIFAQDFSQVLQKPIGLAQLSQVLRYLLYKSKQILIDS